MLIRSRHQQGPEPGESIRVIRGYCSFVATVGKAKLLWVDNYSFGSHQWGFGAGHQEVRNRAAQSLGYPHFAALVAFLKQKTGYREPVYPCQYDELFRVYFYLIEYGNVDPGQNQ